MCEVRTHGSWNIVTDGVKEVKISAFTDTRMKLIAGQPYLELIDD